MKVLALIMFLILTFTAKAETSKLSFDEQEMKVQKVVIRQPLRINLIRLYLRMPSEMRMIAGYRETKETAKSSWPDGLRDRLKSINGQMRL